MGIFTAIEQTSKKLGLSAYEYLRGRISQRLKVPSLTETIQIAAASG